MGMFLFMLFLFTLRQTFNGGKADWVFVPSNISNTFLAAKNFLLGVLIVGVGYCKNSGVGIAFGVGNSSSVLVCMGWQVVGWFCFSFLFSVFWIGVGNFSWVGIGSRAFTGKGVGNSCLFWLLVKGFFFLFLLSLVAFTWVGFCLRVGTLLWVGNACFRFWVGNEGAVCSSGMGWLFFFLQF